MKIHIPFLQTGNCTIDKAFRTAIGDFTGNIHPICKGLLETEQPVIYAGIHYIEPWIRDAAINVWNGASLLSPEVSVNTLFSIIEETPMGRCVGYEDNHYWDAVISIIGFWEHYLYSGDMDFLATAFEVARNTIAYFEETEYDQADGLFRGLACCLDCISAYPDELAYPVHTRSDYSGAYGCKRLFSQEQLASKGHGIPFKTLSTNCLYFKAYKTLDEMAAALGTGSVADWSGRADKLKHSINQHFWMDDKKYYRYLTGCPVGPGRCDHQEALGHSFAVLFDIAGDERKKHVFKNQHLALAGIPYLWPTFARYRDPKYGVNEYGRGSGTVWPHCQALWAEAALRNGRSDLFLREFMLMAEHAERDGHFAEVLHPDTGEIYGGVQEVNFTSKPRQTWAATGFIRLVLRGLVGMEFMPCGIKFMPLLPPGINRMVLSDLHYRQSCLKLEINGPGDRIESFSINGVLQTEPWLAGDSVGDMLIKIRMQ